MKKFKLGFTLAEVLITLGIIGVVAAIVMPSVMTSYQYSIIGVRLAKFQQQAENAARSFAVMEPDNITAGNFPAFIQQTFIYSDQNNFLLKDGTTLRQGGVIAVGNGHNALMHGAVVGSLRFGPRPEGLPANIRDQVYDFGVTELGYVFPSNAGCLRNIANNRLRPYRTDNFLRLLARKNQISKFPR
jgi:prepilin-type N-terminal cleavage/methylation domain-containing protein